MNMDDQGHMQLKGWPLLAPAATHIVDLFNDTQVLLLCCSICVHAHTQTAISALPPTAKPLHCYASVRMHQRHTVVGFVSQYVATQGISMILSVDCTCSLTSKMLLAIPTIASACMFFDFINEFRCAHKI